MYGFLTTLILAAMTAAPGAVESEGNRLTLGGVLVLEFRAAAGGYTAEQRKAAMQDRVVEILSRPDLGPEQVRVVIGKGGHWAKVMAGPVLLVTATEADARANQSTPAKLAAVWAENFRRGFAAAKPRPIPGEGARPVRRERPRIA
jgi:hypothetical protein